MRVVKLKEGILEVEKIEVSKVVVSKLVRERRSDDDNLSPRLEDAHLKLGKVFTVNMNRGR